MIGRAEAEGGHQVFVQNERHGGPAGQCGGEGPQTGVPPQQAVDRAPTHTGGEVDRLARYLVPARRGVDVHRSTELLCRDQGRGRAGAHPLLVSINALRGGPPQRTLGEVRHQRCHQPGRQPDGDIDPYGVTGRPHHQTSHIDNPRTTPTPPITTQ